MDLLKSQYFFFIIIIASTILVLVSCKRCRSGHTKWKTACYKKLVPPFVGFDVRINKANVILELFRRRVHFYFGKTQLSASAIKYFEMDPLCFSCRKQQRHTASICR